MLKQIAFLVGALVAVAAFARNTAALVVYQPIGREAQPLKLRTS